MVAVVSIPTVHLRNLETGSVVVAKRWLGMAREPGFSPVENENKRGT
jgi:hypothetical protein